MPRVAFDFFAQSPDINIDRTRGHEGSLFPDRIKKLIAGEDAAAMRGQVFQQAKFAHCGQNVASVDLHGHRGDVDFQIAEPEHFTAARRLTQPAQHAADAGDQFARAERFGDVVIAAEFETFDAVGFGGLGSQENDRRRGQDRSLPDVAAEFEAVGAGQHHIQQE